MILHRHPGRIPSARVAYSLGCRDAIAGRRRALASIPALLLPHYEDGYVAQAGLQAASTQRAWSRAIALLETARASIASTASTANTSISTSTRITIPAGSAASATRSGSQGADQTSQGPAGFFTYNPAQEGDTLP